MESDILVTDIIEDGRLTGLARLNIHMRPVVEL